MKVYQALARLLVEEVGSPIFGLVGDANLYLVDSFVREFGGRYISAAHENAAVLMALGHANVSGEVGIASVTHGPAVTNTLTALVEGVKSHTPLVLLCGDTAVIDRDNLQDIPQRELIVATGAGFEQLRAPATAAQDLARAVRRAEAERRPVALNIPTDLQHFVAPDRHGYLLRAPALPKAAPADNDLEEAVAVIASARRPIVLAGRDATGEQDRQALLRLASRLDAPVATTLRARSLFIGLDYNLGVFGTLSTPDAIDAIHRSDCVIAFGASLTSYTTAKGALLAGKRVVQVNTSANDIGRWHIPDVGLIGSVDETVDRIIHWLDEAEVPASGFRGELPKEGLATYAVEVPKQNHAAQLGYIEALAWLNRMLPEDRTVVVDAGRFMGKALQYIDVSAPQYFVHTASSGSIGFGMSYAIGAAEADPARTTVLLVGDGGFMLGGLGEFHSAVRNNSNLIVIVCNDGSYGAEHVQLRSKQMDPSLVIFNWPNFATVADALGGTGITLASAANFDAVAEAISNRAKPLLINLKLDPDEVPLHR